MRILDWIKMPRVSVIFFCCDLFMTLVYSYFDGDLPEEEKLKIEVKSEESEEEVSSGQKKGANTSR